MMKTKMKRIEIFKIATLVVTVMALLPKLEGQIRPPVLPSSKPPRPLCASQFALVNYACGRLPFTPGAPPAPLPVPPTPPSPDDGGGGGDEEGHRNHHNNNHNHDHNHNHNRHSHRHGHRHRHHQTPEEDNCCRWAREVDSQCVCELLVRLPPFLVRPLHLYTLTVGEGCVITYSCGGPI